MQCHECEADFESLSDLTLCAKCSHKFCDACAPNYLEPNHDHTLYQCVTSCVKESTVTTHVAVESIVPEVSNVPELQPGTPLHRPATLRRRRIIARPPLEGISKAVLKRLARRGGVTRISSGCYAEARLSLKAFLSETLRCAVLFADHDRRTTLTARDIIYSLKRQGRQVYGFDSQKDARAMMSKE